MATTVTRLYGDTWFLQTSKNSPTAKLWTKNGYTIEGQDARVQALKFLRWDDIWEQQRSNVILGGFSLAVLGIVVAIIASADEILKGAAVFLGGIIIISAIIIGLVLRLWLNDTSPKFTSHRRNQIEHYGKLIRDLKDPEGSITLTRDDLPVVLLTSMFEDHQDFNDHIFLPLESKQLRDKAKETALGLIGEYVEQLARAMLDSSYNQVANAELQKKLRDAFQSVIAQSTVELLQDNAALYKQLDEDFKEVNIDSHEIAARAYLEAHGFDDQ
mgnify:CR=1 FL=1